MKETNELEVFVNKDSVGSLVYENDEYIYKCNNQNKNDYISLTMPVRSKDYINKSLHPLFEMHLPEGYLLSIIKKHFSKIDKTDDFGLLKIMSSSIKGRVSYKKKNQQKEHLSLDNLIHPSNKDLFNTLVDKFALTSALSGVQPKVIARVKDKATLPVNEYIVKSWGEDYPNLALNEFYCMQVAKKANLDVPEFYISDDNKLFIMKRFDLSENNKTLGFEDMCVLQAKQRDDKYEGSYEGIARTIKTFVSRRNKKQALENFFKMIVINNFVQNGDAHLKNFGLLYEDINNIKLAPTYDIVSTTMYITKDIPALHLLGSKKWWSKKFLIRFAIESCDLSLKESNELYDKCINSLKKVILEIKEKIKDEKDTNTIEFLEKLNNIFKLNLLN